MFHNPYTGGYSGQYNVPNPSVPYDGEIPGGFHPGKRVHIRGYVPGHSDTFRVDFITHNGNIALHLNPRFRQHAVVRNTDYGGWGEEERHGGFPFRHSEQFELEVQVEDDRYVVSVNGNYVFDYYHRVPVQEVSRLAISGDVECHSITYHGGSQTRTNEVFNPPIPSSVPIVGAFTPGKLLQIHGHVPHHARRFEINLQNGHNADNIALHFNPRWDDPHQPHHPVVVRNHLYYGSWGNEERHHPQFPFHKGADFEILILNDGNEWKVAVNGQHFISYGQHFECGMVNHVGFNGDVVIHSVRQFH